MTAQKLDQHSNWHHQISCLFGKEIARKQKKRESEKMQWFKVVSPSNPPKSAPSDFLICSEFVVSRSKFPHSHQSKLLEPGSIDIKSSTKGGCRDCEVWVWFVRAYSNCLFSYCKKRDMCLWCFLFCAILGTVLVLVGFSTLRRTSLSCRVPSTTFSPKFLLVEFSWNECSAWSSWPVTKAPRQSMAQWVLSNRLWHFKLSECLGPPAEPKRGAVHEDGRFEVKTLWALSTTRTKHRKNMLFWHIWHVWTLETEADRW